MGLFGGKSIARHSLNIKEEKRKCKRLFIQKKRQVLGLSLRSCLKVAKIKPYVKPVLIKNSIPQKRKNNRKIGAIQQPKSGKVWELLQYSAFIVHTMRSCNIRPLRGRKGKDERMTTRIPSNFIGVDVRQRTNEGGSCGG